MVWGRRTGRAASFLFIAAASAAAAGAGAAGRGGVYIQTSDIDRRSRQVRRVQDSTYVHTEANSATWPRQSPP